MGLVPGAQGQKSVFADGIQVDHLSENTVGHGVRVKGISDPTTYPVIAGDVGETLYSSLIPLSTPIPGASATFGNVVSMTLNKGVYLVTFKMSGGANGATLGTADGVLGISTDATASFSDRLDGDTSIYVVVPTSTSALIGGSISRMLVITVDSTTIYGKLRLTYSGGTPQVGGRLSATRIA